MVTLTNVSTAYDGITASRGLGISDIDFTGVTQITFRVFVSKVGTGTQNWQLWNVTDGSQITLLQDAGAAGDKTLSTSVAVSLTGVKTIRVRALSSVGTDDPLFYGASVLTVGP